MTLISFAVQGTPWFGVMFILGGTIGIPMVLTYPFSIIMKSVIIIGLFLSIIAFAYGLKHNKKTYAQVLAVVGFTTWSFIGMIGLGTGT